MVLPEENLHVQVTGPGQVGRGEGLAGGGTSQSSPRQACLLDAAGQSRRNCRTSGHTARRPRTYGKRGRSSSHFAQRSEYPPAGGGWAWEPAGPGLAARSVSHLLCGPGNGASFLDPWVQILASHSCVALGKAFALSGPVSLFKNAGRE